MVVHATNIVNYKNKRTVKMLLTFVIKSNFFIELNIKICEETNNKKVHVDYIQIVHAQDWHYVALLNTVIRIVAGSRTLFCSRLKFPERKQT